MVQFYLGNANTVSSSDVTGAAASPPPAATTAAYPISGDFWALHADFSLNSMIFPC